MRGKSIGHSLRVPSSACSTERAQFRPAMNSADAHTELARHWRHSALHEDKTHSVHEELRQQLAASSVTTPADLAAAVSALPPRAFLRLLSRTTFGCRCAQRIREI